MWLSVPCSECSSRENLAPVGVHRIQGKCVYPCLTPNALLRVAVCSVQARKHDYLKYDIRSRTCGYTELSEARPSYAPLRISISPALYKILLRLEQCKNYALITLENDHSCNVKCFALNCFLIKELQKVYPISATKFWSQGWN